MRTWTHEERALVGITTTIAVVDVILIRNGHGSLSGVIRRSRVLRTAVVGLTAHLVMTLPYDPLTLFAKVLTSAPGKLPAPPDRRS